MGQIGSPLEAHYPKAGNGRRLVNRMENVMIAVGSFEAKTYWSALHERVQRGERITITKHGVPVAVLVPAESTSRKNRKQVIGALKLFGHGRSLPEGMTIRHTIEEGHRYRNLY
jgi:prevent-host-death family protein